MPYHVKTPGQLEVGDVYWKGDNTWTDTYSDRYQFAQETDALAVKNTTVTKNGVNSHYAYHNTNTDGAIFQTVYQLQRGDYLQCKGSWLADQSYESFFIEKA